MANDRSTYNTTTKWNIIRHFLNYYHRGIGVVNFEESLIIFHFFSYYQVFNKMTTAIDCNYVSHFLIIAANYARNSQPRILAILCTSCKLNLCLIRSIFKDTTEAHLGLILSSPLILPIILQTNQNISL